MDEVKEQFYVQIIINLIKQINFLSLIQDSHFQCINVEDEINNNPQKYTMDFIPFDELKNQEVFMSILYQIKSKIDIDEHYESFGVDFSKI